MTILTSLKVDLRNRSLILPVIGKGTFDQDGKISIEDDNKALQLIEDTVGSIDLIDIESIKKKSIDSELGGSVEGSDPLSEEGRRERLIEKIASSTFKELKVLAGDLVRGQEGIKYSDWANLRKDDLTKFLVDLITPEQEEDDETAADTLTVITTQTEETAKVADEIKTEVK